MKMKTNPKVTLNDFADSLKWKIRNSPADILKTRHESLIEEESYNLKERK